MGSCDDINWENEGFQHQKYYYDEEDLVAGVPIIKMKEEIAEEQGRSLGAPLYSGKSDKYFAADGKGRIVALRMYTNRRAWVDFHIHKFQNNPFGTVHCHFFKETNGVLERDDKERKVSNKLRKLCESLWKAAYEYNKKIDSSFPEISFDFIEDTRTHKRIRKSDKRKQEHKDKKSKGEQS